MLDVFVTQNREEIIRRCRVKVEARSHAVQTASELAHGVPRFLDELVVALRQEPASSLEIGLSAARHGSDLHRQGFTVSQVVHVYGDVCQSITDLAVELNAPITVLDFRTLNRCLDDAIASAVTEFGHDTASMREAEAASTAEPLGFLAHEVRNLVGTASVAFEVLRTGNVGVGGSTGRVLQRSLAALRELINRSIAEVRLGREIRERSEFGVAEFLADLAPGAAQDATVRGLTFHVDPGDPLVTVLADRPILTATVSNLVQNAFKFTRPGTTVILRGGATADRVLIEVEDQCGGLPDGHAEELFEPFAQRGDDRTGLGLGLAISRWGVEANQGRIYARSLPDRGCVFTVDLPRVVTLDS